MMTTATRVKTIPAVVLEFASKTFRLHPKDKTFGKRKSLSINH